MQQSTLASISTKTIKLLVEAEDQKVRQHLANIVQHLQSKFIENQKRTRIAQICTLNGIAVILNQAASDCEQPKLLNKIYSLISEINTTLDALKPSMMKEVA